MSHDKVVMFIDDRLKDVISDEDREELLQLHYASIHQASTKGYRKGLQADEELSAQLHQMAELAEAEPTPTSVDVPEEPTVVPEPVTNKEASTAVITLMVGAMMFAAVVAVVIIDLLKGY